MINNGKYAVKGIFEKRDTKEDYCIWYFPSIQKNGLSSNKFLEFLCYNLKVNKDKSIENVYRVINSSSIKMPYIRFSKDSMQVSLKVFMFYLDRLNKSEDFNGDLNSFIINYDSKIEEADRKLEADKQAVNEVVRPKKKSKRVIKHLKYKDDKVETLDFLEDFNLTDVDFSTNDSTHNFN
jgi:hypothetical protein